MTNEEKDMLLTNALDFILSQNKDDDYICETLLDTSIEEHNLCQVSCNKMNKDCIIRFLKNYDKRK